jgi:tetratricopeptide (TPR) repeat protein
MAVIARNSSFGYRHADLAAIRDDLGADFAVQGSVRRVDDQLRLAVQLVDLSTGVNRWANRFERPYADLPGVLDEVSSGLAAALAARARDAVAERGASGTDVLSAYELAMKARRALQSFEREQTFAALSFVEQALEADPEYAVAWDLLAQLRVQFFIQPYDGQRGDPATLELAREAAAKAIALDPAYSTARATLAGLISRQGDYDGALEMLRQALELNPNDATALSTYADILDRAGDHDASLAAWRALERIDPAGPTLRLALTARAQMFTGDHEGALATARICETRAPQFQPCLVFLAISAAAAGNEAGAREAGQRLLAVNPRFTITGHFQLVPFRRPEDIELMRQHLKTAGLPD